MIGIVYATLREARPYLAFSIAKELAAAPFKLYRLTSPSVTVAISGMGKVPAALATQILIREHHCDRVLNAGVCGSLSDSAGLAPGNILRISSVSEGPPGPGESPGVIRCAGDLWPDLPEARLVTVERPVFSDTDRQRLATWGDLVDMEGAVVARVAHIYGTPWDMIKGITDLASDGSRANLHRNLDAVSVAVAERLNNEISIYATSKC